MAVIRIDWQRREVECDLRCVRCGRRWKEWLKRPNLSKIRAVPQVQGVCLQCALYRACPTLAEAWKIANPES